MEAKATERKKRRWLGRLGRLGVCVCQTKNPIQRWLQQLVSNKKRDSKTLISCAKCCDDLYLLLLCR
jgi:hypothetical protein